MLEMFFIVDLGLKVESLPWWVLGKRGVEFPVLLDHPQDLEFLSPPLCPWGFLCRSTLRTTGHMSSQWCTGRWGTEMRKAQAAPHCHFQSPPHHQLVHPAPWKQWLVCKRSLVDVCCLNEWPNLDSRVAGPSALRYEKAQCNWGTERNSVKVTSMAVLPATPPAWA